MPNQFETNTSDAGTTIHLKMNGELVENLIALDLLALTFFDILFVYGVYEVYAENDSFLTFFLIFILLPFLFYLHSEYRKNRRWIKNAEETFFISKNNIHISKEYLGDKLLTQDINTQKIIEIVYRPWGGSSNPPFLPDCSQGTIHLITYGGGGCSFGINLNKEEAEAFITELRSLIMQYQEPRHFIFAPHMHLTKD